MAKVLVVDDSRVQRRVVAQILLELGHEVLEAENGSQAIQALEDNNECICMLLDLHMPVLNGVELLKALGEANRKRLTVMVISSSIRDDLYQQCLDLGVKYFLKKPYSSSELRQMLKEIVVQN